jgi:predicted LPLAT superfamily acyltransferase
MAWASVRFGRRLSRLMLYPIVAYFFLTSAKARASTRAFLRRVLAREPTIAGIYRVLFNFSTTIHDRIYFLKGRFDLFELEMHGAESLPAGGLLLLGAHVGSFEALRACARSFEQRKVAIAMYEENAQRLNAILAAIEPSASEGIIPLGRVDAMVQLGHRLENGEIVGMLADRSLGDEPVIRVPFLGREAPFPTGPMRIAAALRAQVVFMSAVYRGGNRYEIRFEPLADFSGEDGNGRARRAERVEAGVRAYAQRLEALARSAPDNWFNFFDFWAGP